MTPTWISFTCGAGVFAAYAVLAPVVVRLPGPVSPVVRQTALALVLQVALAVLALCLGVPYWHGAALFGCGFTFALFAYSAVYKSISLGMLTALGHQGAGLTLRQVTAEHILPSFMTRIHLLIAAGYVTVSDGRFRVTEAGRRLAGRIAAVQKVFGITRCGLYGLAHSPQTPSDGQLPQLPIDVPPQRL
jgi:hypothetical protein